MKTIGLFVFLSLLAWTPLVLATLPVVDIGAIVKAAEQIAQLKNQISIMQHEYQQMKDTHLSITGQRGMGDLYNHPTFNNALPNEWNSVYKSGTPIARHADEIEQEERRATQAMSVNDSEHYIQQRQLHTASANKAMGELAYQGMISRLNNIELLLANIKETRDPKGIAELQARIAAEQAIVQNEQTKLTVMQNLQQSEQQLIEHQQDELSSKILDPNNSEVPHLPTD